MSGRAVAVAEVLVGLLVSCFVLLSMPDLADCLSEIVFNPLKDWFRRGPFTKLFFTFLRSPLPTHSKWGILSYIFSYYALSISWWVSILNYMYMGVWAFDDSFCESR